MTRTLLRGAAYCDVKRYNVFMRDYAHPIYRNVIAGFRIVMCKL